MEFHKKYRHVGISYPGVPKGWVPIFERAIVAIEKEMWPGWMSFHLKRLIHWLAAGNSVVCIKFRWAERLRDFCTHGQMITDIKEKYATLRIHGHFREDINKIIREAETECEKTCQECGNTEDVKINDGGWLYNLCPACTETIL